LNLEKNSVLVIKHVGRMKLLYKIMIHIKYLVSMD